MAKKKIPEIVKRIMNTEIPEVNYAFEKVVSHSQLTIGNSCEFRWKLQYKDRLKPFTSSIHTIFGTAIHEAIQSYLDVMYKYSKAKADDLDLVDIFETVFREEYKKGYKSNSKEHFSSPGELQDFFEDGAEILGVFKKKVTTHFGKRGWYLIGCELPLNVGILNSHKNVKFYGKLDIVLYDSHSEMFKLIDIKTSKNSWGKYQKEDKQKLSQLILYKHFFAKQYGIDPKKIDIEFFIVKRKLWEESDFPQSRIQTFVPASGTTSIKRALESLENFVIKSFNKDGSIQDRVYKKHPSENTCKFCPFNNTEHCDKSIF